MSRVAVCCFLLAVGSDPVAALKAALAQGNRAEIAASLHRDRQAGKACFAELMDEYLAARLEGSAEAEKKLGSHLSVLAEIYAADLREPHLRAILAEASGWDRAAILQKREVDRAYLAAEKLWRQRQAGPALTKLDEILPVCRRLPYTKGAAAILILKGKILWDQGETREAESNFLAARAAADELSYRTFTLAALSGLGELYLRSGRYAEAKESFEQYLARAREVDDEEAASRALGNLGQAALELGRHDEAESLFERSLSLPGRDRAFEAKCQLGLGQLHCARGNYRAAFGAFERVSAAANDALTSSALINLGALWFLQGDADRARESYEKALEIEKRLGREAQIAAVRNNIANIYAAQGELARARGELEQALAVQRRLGEPGRAARTLANLCRLAWRDGKDAEGQAFYSEALEKLSAVGDQTTRVELMTGKALRELDQGKDAEARKTLEEAERLLDKVRDHGSIGLLQVGLGKADLAEGARAAACEHFRKAIEHGRLQREQVTSARYRDLFFTAGERQELTAAFALLAGALVDRGENAEAFGVAEEAKAQGMLAEILAGTEARARVPEEVRQRESELRARQAALREKLAEARGAEFEALAAEFDRNERDHRDIAEKIWSQFPRLRPNAGGSLAATQPLLSPKTLLLEYLLGPESSLLFVVAREDLAVVQLPGEAEIERRVEAFVRQCRDPLGAIGDEAEALARLLLGGAAERVAASGRLVVVADGALHGLPFGALKLNGKYLAETLPIHTIPSVAFTLLAEKERGEKPDGERRDLVLGDPAYREREVLDPRLGWGELALARLEASGLEAAAVARILETEPLLGAAATESALKAALPRARYLHLAVHAFLHPRRPELSCLALARGGGEDGILEARELGSTTADLVVLSACESARGELARAEGYLGFGRALFIAGARTLILSAWPVNDRSSAELMPAFWKAVRQGRDPAVALAEAQRWFLASARAGSIAIADSAQRGKFEKVAKRLAPDHPFFWAGFMVLSREIEP